MQQVKVLASEINGVEIDAMDYDLNAATIPFNAPNFVSDNIEGAILEAKNSGGFPLKYINSGESVYVGERREMILTDEIYVDGEIVIDGELTIL
jgi:hypothetical protein